MGNSFKNLDETLELKGVQETKSFTASDGEIFLRRIDAEKHEMGLAVALGITRFFNAYGCNQMRVDDAVDICLEHIEELQAIFEGKAGASK